MIGNISAFLFPCIIGALMGLIVLNYWHALRCESADEHDESEYYVKALEKRLAMAEYESSLNDQ